MPSSVLGCGGRVLRHSGGMGTHTPWSSSQRCRPRPSATLWVEAAVRGLLVGVGLGANYGKCWGPESCLERLFDHPTLGARSGLRGRGQKGLEAQPGPWSLWPGHLSLPPAPLQWPVDPPRIPSPGAWAGGSFLTCAGARGRYGRPFLGCARVSAGRRGGRVLAAARVRRRRATVRRLGSFPAPSLRVR